MRILCFPSAAVSASEMPLCMQCHAMMLFKAHPPPLHVAVVPAVCIEVLYQHAMSPPPPPSGSYTRADITHAWIIPS